MVKMERVRGECAVLETGAISASQTVQIPGKRKGKTSDVIGVAGAPVLPGLYPQDAQDMVGHAVSERGLTLSWLRNW